MKNPIQCKLTVNDQTVEQIMTFTYLGGWDILLPGLEIWSSSDKESGKSSRMSKRLGTTNIWDRKGKYGSNMRPTNPNIRDRN